MERQLIDCILVFAHAFQIANSNSVFLVITVRSVQSNSAGENNKHLEFG